MPGRSGRSRAANSSPSRTAIRSASSSPDPSLASPTASPTTANSSPIPTSMSSASRLIGKTTTRSPSPRLLRASMSFWKSPWLRVRPNASISSPRRSPPRAFSWSVTSAALIPVSPSRRKPSPPVASAALCPCMPAAICQRRRGISASTRSPRSSETASTTSTSCSGSRERLRPKSTGEM